jgi:type IV pilus assembly protein PilB
MTLPLSPDTLKETLLSLGVTDEPGWKALLEEAERRGADLETVIVDRELLTDENFGKLIADQYGVPYVHLASAGVAAEVRGLVPESLARAQRLLPFASVQEGLKVAMHDPSNHEAIRILEKKAGKPILPAFATLRDLEKAFGIYRQGIKETFSDLLGSHVTAAGSSFRPEDLPVTKIVDALLEQGFENGASDIHIEPQREDTVVRFRVDGILRDVLTIPKRIHDLLVARIKILAKLKTDEHRSAQDGKFTYAFETARMDIRVSIAPFIEGEKVVMRLLSEKTRRFALEELGLRGADLQKIHTALQKPWGMILSTGPTGSGKTTTLYAMLRILNERAVHIATIEDPVEYELSGVSQIQVNPETNLTFADGLRSILRQDPDIIMVGEIRDAETGEIAVNAAMTGHLLLSTVHTNDAATTITRLLEMKIEPFLLSSTINIIIAQRLVRRNCRTCLVSYEVPVAKLEGTLPSALMANLFRDKKTVLLYRGKGCSVCGGTGMVGRIGIFEVLEVTEAIRTLLGARASADEIRRKAIEEGMTTMFEDGIQKVLSGETTIEEVQHETRM